MRIAYDYQIFCEQRYGGISRYFYELARRVAEIPGCYANVVAPLYVNEYLKNREVDVKGIFVPQVRQTGRIIRAINRIVAPLMVGSLRPDVVHETYHSFRTTAPSNCPTVVTVYDMIHEKFHDIFPKSKIFSDAKRAAVARADHVICISEHTRQDLIEFFGVAPEKTTVIHLGYTLTRNGNFRLFPLSRPFLLFVGDRRGYKNFDRLLQAYADSAILRREFVLVAFGWNAFTAAEIGLIRELGLDESVVCHMAGGDDVLASLYQQATLFIYPSLYEGFGIPLLEAMSFDCPVVCSNTSSIPEVGGDAAEFFDPMDIYAIRVAIEKVAMSSEVRARLVERGRKRIQCFSWDRCAAETIEVYDTLA